MKTYLHLPLQCDWPSSPAAEQPGLHRPEAGESVWPAAPVEHQSLDTRCWSTHTTKNALEDCLARQGKKITNGSCFCIKIRRLKYCKRARPTHQSDFIGCYWPIAIISETDWYWCIFWQRCTDMKTRFLRKNDWGNLKWLHIEKFIASGH